MYTFQIFSGLPLTHAVFSRHGGVSEGDFTSLNMGLSQGDDPQSVMQNRQIACEKLNLDTLCSLKQVHSDLIVEADPTASIEADGQMTNHPRLGLLILHADCQAAIIYDPINHALANVHCGWRGNVQNIYAKTVAQMAARFGSNPENLLVGISPSLGPEAAEFVNFKDEFPDCYWDFQQKNHFDLWELSRYQLIS
nr:polyphenol oxidase family protein [Chlamydiota bacterium]